MPPAPCLAPDGWQLPWYQNPSHPRGKWTACSWKAGPASPEACRKGLPPILLSESLVGLRRGSPDIQMASRLPHTPGRLTLKARLEVASPRCIIFPRVHGPAGFLACDLAACLACRTSSSTLMSQSFSAL